jgi:ABC-type amino acid transport substrate-binding protein
MLRIAYTGDRPTDYLDDGRLVGIHGEVRTRVAAILGLEVATVEMPFVEMIPALERREIDTLAIGTAWTPSRARAFQYTQPYQYFFFGVAHRGGAPAGRALELERVLGASVSALDGSFNNEELAPLMAAAGGTLRLGATLDAVVADLLGGISQFGVYDFPNIAQALARADPDGGWRVDPLRFDGRFPLNTARMPLRLMFDGDAVHLRGASDLAIDALELSGELAAIYARHGFDPRDLLSLTPF